MDAAIISVHSQFPKNVMSNIELDLDPTNWEWKKCLVFPVDRLNALAFSSKPFKWIRYATGIVVGAHGDLCTKPDLPKPVPIDYDSCLSAVSKSIDLYYHTTDEEKRHMLPIDPELADTRTVTSSRTSTCQDDFWEEVEDRDGICVLTGHPAAACDAAHLLPHSKGDTYIKSFSTRRRRDSSGDDVIVEDINDVRNGLFLSASVRRLLVGQQLAFLKTPNFAMVTTDVDPNADSAQERLTSHLFDQSQGFERIAGPSGSAVRVPPDTSIWPPAVLFDAVYASAVVHHFGFGLAAILEKWGDVFYPVGPTRAAHEDDKYRRDQQQSYNRHNRRRSRHYGIDPFDVVMMYRFQAMEPEAVGAYLEGCEEMAAASERKGLEEKVDSWRESLAPPIASDAAD